MKFLKFAGWLIWKLSPVRRPRAVSGSHLPGNENTQIAGPDSASLEIRTVDGDSSATAAVSAPEVRLVQLPQTVLCAPGGLSFYGEFVVAESNFRPGYAGDAAAINKVSPWPLRRQKATLDLLQSDSPKFFFRLAFNNYYHFLLESVPALILAQRAVPDLHLIIPSRFPSVWNRNLQFFHAGNPSILRPGNWKVRNQVFVSIRSGLGAHGEALQALRSIKTGVARAHRISIYVSRLSSSRSLAFEEILEEHLRSLGFKIVAPEDLTNVSRNAELFKSAKLVIGPHGAGLANIVFCRPGTPILELAVKHFHNNLFSEISSRLGLKHYLAYLQHTSMTDFGSGKEAIGLVERFLAEVRGEGNLS